MDSSSSQWDMINSHTEWAVADKIKTETWNNSLGSE